MMMMMMKKCCTFGMMQNNGTFSQIETGLYLNTKKIPSTAIGGKFPYLKNFVILKTRTAKMKITDEFNVRMKITYNLKTAQTQNS